MSDEQATTLNYSPELSLSAVLARHLLKNRSDEWNAKSIAELARDVDRYYTSAVASIRLEARELAKRLPPEYKIDEDLLAEYTLDDLIEMGKVLNGTAPRRHILDAIESGLFKPSETYLRVHFGPPVETPAGKLWVHADVFHFYAICMTDDGEVIFSK